MTTEITKTSETGLQVGTAIPLRTNVHLWKSRFLPPSPPLTFTPVDLTRSRRKLCVSVSFSEIKLNVLFVLETQGAQVG